MRAEKYFKHLLDPIVNPQRTKEIFSYNPTVEPAREEAKMAKIYVYDYNAGSVSERELKNISETFVFCDNGKVNWVNIDGIVKSDVERICSHFQIHSLLVEDILSIGQRPKMDEIEGVMFCLLNMLYFNDDNCSVEQEQISIAVGKDFVLTFQEDAHRDVFNNIRGKLHVATSRLRQRGADYLCYSMIDMIIDHYFVVMEKLGEKI